VAAARRDRKGGSVRHRIKAWQGVALAPLLVLLLVGCQQREPTRWDEAQQESRGQPAVAPEAEKGSAFNRFFPKPAAPFDLVYKQEKTGFAQASLQQNGREVALLSISDTVSNPEAQQKYQGSGKTLAGYPVAAIGSQGTGLLVANRYQVQVRSMSPSFSPADREEWLQRFDLNGLSQLR
jgi:hypothetical protein